MRVETPDLESDAGSGRVGGARVDAGLAVKALTDRRGMTHQLRSSQARPGTAVAACRKATLVLMLCCCLGVFACAAEQAPLPGVALAVDGPSLGIAGEYAGMELRGSMDRTCMAGYGHISLHALDPEQEFVCEADVDDPPTDRARVRGMLRCTGERTLLFSLRNIGPDQGVGIARESEEGGLMVLFYHAAEEEAVRRLPGVKEDIARAMAGIQ